MFSKNLSAHSRESGATVARKVVLELTDDLDGSDAGQTVSFGFRGVEYEIDLNDKNAAKLEKALSPYIEAGRRASRRRRGASKRQAEGAAGVRPAAVRQWAQEQGLAISARGRIPAQVVERYKESVGQPA